MNKEMFDELMQRLDAVGAKIGQAGSAMWAMTVRQEIINGSEYIAAGLLLCVAGIFTLAVRRKWMKWVKDDDGKKTTSVFAIIIAIGCFVGTTFFWVNAVDLLLNPGFWALRDLLMTVRGR